MTCCVFVLARMKMFVVGRKQLYQLPSVLMTRTREVVQAGVDVAVARVLDVARRPEIDHLEARPAVWMMYQTLTMSSISQV